MAAHAGNDGHAVNTAVEALLATNSQARELAQQLAERPLDPATRQQLREFDAGLEAADEHLAVLRANPIAVRRQLAQLGWGDDSTTAESGEGAEARS